MGDIFTFQDFHNAAKPLSAWDRESHAALEREHRAYCLGDAFDLCLTASRAMKNPETNDPAAFAAAQVDLHAKALIAIRTVNRQRLAADSADLTALMMAVTEGNHAEIASQVQRAATAAPLDGTGGRDRALARSHVLADTSGAVDIMRTILSKPKDLARAAGLVDAGTPEARQELKDRIGEALDVFYDAPKGAALFTALHETLQSIGLKPDAAPQAHVPAQKGAPNLTIITRPNVI